MAFSSGTYTLPGPALSTGDTVSATENNTLRNDMASSFNLTWLRNGTAAATADIPMGGYKITGLAAATSTGDALAYGRAATVTDLTTTGNTILGDASTDTLNVGNGGLIKDASGNVGVGVTPSAWGSNFKVVQVGRGTALWSGTATDATFLSQNAYYDGTNFKYLQTAYASYYSSQLGQHLWYNAPSGTAGNAITFTQAMTLAAGGNLLVNATATAGSGTLAETLNITGISTSTSYITRFINPTSTSGNAFGSLITYSGVSPNGTSNAFLAGQDSTTNRFYFASNGGLYNYSANNSNLSDQREKKNINIAGSYLDKICAIPVKTFLFNDQTDEDLNLGVIAQDVQAVAPELVMESNWAKEGDDPKMRLSIYQTDLQYALMKCIQEQQALITQLQADVAALKGA